MGGQMQGARVPLPGAPFTGGIEPPLSGIAMERAGAGGALGEWWSLRRGYLGREDEGARGLARNGKAR